MPTCVGLANDMLSCIPEVMRNYKRMIDHGFDLALGDAMEYEVDICRIHVPPRAEQVAEGRATIQERGRSQAKT